MVKLFNNKIYLITLSLFWIIGAVLSFYYFPKLIGFFYILLVPILFYFILCIKNIKTILKSKDEEILKLSTKLSFISNINMNVLQDMDYGFVLTDKDFNILHKNKAFDNIFETDESDIKNLSVFFEERLKNKDYYDKKIKMLSEGKNLEKTSIELILQNNDIIKSHVFFINNEAALAKKEYVFIFKNYTEERKSSTNFEILINNIDEMIGIFDSEKKIIKYNAALKKFFFEFEDIELFTKINLLEMISSEYLKFWGNIFEKGIKGEGFSKEIIYTSNNSKKSIFININVSSIYNSNGEITGFILTLKDISSIKNMYKEISLLRNEIEKNKLSKNKILERIGKEIRTPLNNIISGIELLNFEKLHEKDREILDILSRSSENILIFFNDMNDFIKLDEGHIKISKDNFNIELDLEEVPYLCNDINLKLNFNIIHKDVIGDKNKLKYIILNILKYISDNHNYTHLELSVTEQPIDNILSKYILSFSYNKNSVFNKKKSIPADKKIGLIIAEKYIEIMKGKVKYSDSTDIVYCFEMIFSLKNSSDIKKSEKTFSDLKSKKVLIVEDNKMNQIVMQKLLNMVKINSEIAENGEEAVNRNLNEAYDVILMDIQMPVLNGYEAAKKIREHEKISKKRVPIIALTAYAMQSDREKCLEAGMDDYMSKPVIKNELFEMIERYTTKDKY